MLPTCKLSSVLQHRVVWQWLDANSEVSIHLSGVLYTLNAIPVLIICYMDMLIKLSLLASYNHVVALLTAVLSGGISLMLLWSYPSSWCCYSSWKLLEFPVLFSNVFAHAPLERKCHCTVSNDILHGTYQYLIYQMKCLIKQRPRQEAASSPQGWQ